MTINWPDTFSGCAHAENFYNKFLEIIHLLIDKYVPFKKLSSKAKYPKFIRTLQSKKRYLWRKCKTDPSFKLKYEEHNKIIEKTISEYIDEKELCLLKKGSNLKHFFQFFNKKLKVKRSIPDIDSGENQLSEDLLKANKFNDFFSSVFTQDNGIFPNLKIVSFSCGVRPLGTLS